MFVVEQWTSTVEGYRSSWVLQEQHILVLQNQEILLLQKQNIPALQQHCLSLTKNDVVLLQNLTVLF